LTHSVFTHLCIARIFLFRHKLILYKNSYTELLQIVTTLTTTDKLKKLYTEKTWTLDRKTPNKEHVDAKHKYFCQV